MSQQLTAKEPVTPELSLNSIIQQARKYESEDNYYQPVESELVLFEQLFATLLSSSEPMDNETLNELTKTALELGFIVQRFPQGLSDYPYDLTILMEEPGRNSGRGLYCFTNHLNNNESVPRHTMVQCPHARSDAYTGWLGFQLFKQGNASAYFTSTMRRNVPTHDQRTNATPTPTEDLPESKAGVMVVHGPADPSHNPSSFFQSAHRSWMRKYPATLVIQFHGFKRIETMPERQFDLILSCGQLVENQSVFFLESERILKSCLPRKKLGVFGRDTNIFGALTNVQGIYVNMYTSGIFWHLEMDYQFRKTLREQDALRSRFLKCISQLMEVYETH